VDRSSLHGRPAIIADEEYKRVVFQFLFAQRLEHATNRIVHRRHHAGIGLSTLVTDAFEFFKSIIGSVHRCVHGIEREVEEEWLFLMTINERDCLAAERIGEVFLFVDRFVVAAQRRLGALEVTVRAAKKSEGVLKAAILGNKWK